MASLKVFVKDGCSRCPGAKAVAECIRLRGFDVQEYDVGTADGMAEGAFYGVLSTPTVLVVDESDNPVRYWRGEAPDADEVITML